MAGQHGWRQARVAALFVGPSLLGLALFTIGPLLASLGISLTSWDLLTPPQFVGLANFTELLRSSEIHDALLHTLLYIVLYLPTVLVLGLCLPSSSIARCVGSNSIAPRSLCPSCRRGLPSP